MNRLRLLREYLRFRFYARYRPGRFPSVNLSFSQYGEDMVLAALLGDDPERFYLDIGAHHPVLGSNTYHFYLRGWRGINVDALPGAMELFGWLRPRDVNLEAAVATRAGETREFYCFAAPALNTLDSDRAAELERTGHPIQRVVSVRCVTCPEILAAHLPRGQRVSFLNIDVEQLDAAILASIDWTSFRPRVVAFEALGIAWEDLAEHESVRLLRAHGYALQAKTGPTVLMVRA